jgi:hypothetical protein
MTQSETQVHRRSAIILPCALPAARSSGAQYPEDLVGAAMFLLAGERLHDWQMINVNGGMAMH